MNTTSSGRGRKRKRAATLAPARPPPPLLPKVDGRRLRISVKECLFCDHVFRTYWHLEEHMTVHTQERPYLCPYCPMDFTMLGTFNLHVNFVHRGIKFSCDACPKEYPTAAMLSNHRRRHHMRDSVMSRIASYQINKVLKKTVIINRRASASPEKRRRKRRIEEGEGVEGGQETRITRSRRPEVKGEVKIKEEEPERMCDICGKRFKSQHHLKMHRNKHTGVCPYKCGQCDAMFGAAGALYIHRRQVHGYRKSATRQRGREGNKRGRKTGGEPKVKKGKDEEFEVEGKREGEEGQLVTSVPRTRARRRMEGRKAEGTVVKIEEDEGDKIEGDEEVTVVKREPCAISVEEGNGQVIDLEATIAAPPEHEGESQQKDEEEATQKKEGSLVEAFSENSNSSLDVEAGSPKETLGEDDAQGAKEMTEEQKNLPNEMEPERLKESQNDNSTTPPNTQLISSSSSGSIPPPASLQKYLEPDYLQKLNCTEAPRLPLSVVLLDPATNQVTPLSSSQAAFPPTTYSRDQPPPHPPNIFFCEAGQITMPLFSLEVLRTLARYSPYLIPPEIKDTSHSKEEIPRKLPTKRKIVKAKTNTQSKVPRRPNTDPSKPHVCTKCGERFRYQCRLSEHIVIAHTNQRPYPCNLCSFRYRQRMSVVNHVITQHCSRVEGEGDEPLFYCVYCAGNSTLGTKEELQKHITRHFKQMREGIEKAPAEPSTSTGGKEKAKKRGRKPKGLKSEGGSVGKGRKGGVKTEGGGEGAHKCDMCGTRFQFKCHLNRHHLYHHTDIVPYSCQFCAARYRQRQTLLDHLMMKHCLKGEGDGGTFECVYCERTGGKTVFEKKEELQRHVTQHWKQEKKEEKKVAIDKEK